MAFAYTADRSYRAHIGGNLRQVGGTWTNTDDVTSGSITTGLKQVIVVLPNITSSEAPPSVSYSISGGTVTFYPGNGTDGRIVFQGRGGG